MNDFGAWSLLPPCMAIILAIATRRVVLSLLGGLTVAAFILLLTEHSFLWSLLAIIPKTFSLIAGHAPDPEAGLRGIGMLRGADLTLVVIMIMLLGGFSAVLEATGGARAFSHAIVRRVKSVRGAQLAAAVMGCSLFTSAYFSALATGSVFRPIFDRLAIPRVKLAFIVDATAAPINTLVPISGWIAFMILLMHDNFPGNPDGFETLLATIPFNLYAWAIVLFVFINAMGWIPDFGPMRRAKTELGQDDGSADETEQASCNNASALQMILPLGVSLILIVVLGLWNYVLASPNLGLGWTKLPLNGNEILILAFGAGILASAVMAFAARLMPPTAFLDALIVGCKQTLIPSMIIVLAITMGDLCRAQAPEGLGTANYLANLLGGALPVALLPATCFLLAAITSFSTGTSWGTWGILIPLAIPLAMADGGNLFLVAGAVISGGCFGDHCSPISDTTVMSSLGAGVEHTDHVNTQLPYALSVGAICLALFTSLGFML